MNLHPLERNEDLVLALTAFIDPRTPSRIHSILRSEGRDGLRRTFDSLSDIDRGLILEEADRLADKEIKATLLGDEIFPDQLGRLASTSPVLFYWGNESLFLAASVGMCGSRNASDTGLRAATACGEVAAQLGMAVVSGYAKGVDTATHLAALKAGGQTVIVLAEGFDHFRIKKAFPRELFKRSDVLVVSQFPPSQKWTAGAAMTRNRIIYGLGISLVVVEAGEKGGTLAAGEGALNAEKPVLVLDFGDTTPAGNRLLLERGGIPVGTQHELAQQMVRTRISWAGKREQLSLL